MKESLTLTIKEIRYLAIFCGFLVNDYDKDEDYEITIEPCPEIGVSDDGEIIHTRYIAYFEDYPEEGVFPLGDPQTETTTQP